MSPSRSISALRESMRKLPLFLQPFLTWLSGMPLSGELPTLRWSPWRHVVVVVIQIVVSISVGVLLLREGGVAWLALPLSWLLTTGAVRYFYIVIGHYASHGTFSKRRGLNRLIGEVQSALFTTLSFDDYQRDHVRFHHSKRLATPHDPDVRFLIAHGFEPGRPRTEYWRLLWRTLLSPRYHVDYLMERLRSNLVTPPIRRRLLGASFLIAQLLWVVATGAWIEWTLLWFVPVVIGFQASALLQFLSEHLWLAAPGEGQLRLGRLTFARFLGDHYPSDRRGRARHVARLLFVHLPARLGVLVGDLIQHDLHHRRPRSDWSNAIFVRRDDVAAGSPGWPEPYFEVWGSLFDHIDTVFNAWSERAPLTDEERQELNRPIV